VRAVAAVLALVLAVPAAAPAASASDAFHLLRLDGTYLKWGAPALGTPAHVRYAFVTAPVRFPGAINCDAMVPIEPMLKASAIGAERFRSEVKAAFAMWQQAADVAFSEVAEPAAADILIGAQAKPRGFAFTNVDYDHAASGPVRVLKKSLICFNPDKPWKTGFDGNVEVYDIRYAMAHEIGHAIGLDHPSPSGELMSFRYGEDFRTLRAGDESGAIALYGKPGAPVVVAAPKPGAPPPDMALR
jgi:hypothetical protein